jgi:phospholipase C
VFIGVLAVLFLIAPVQGETPEGSSNNSAIQTVFVIVMENQNWEFMRGSSSLPYLNNTLLPQASYAEQYYNPPSLHPSLPNYLWLEAGTNFGIRENGPPSRFHQSTTAHLVTLLDSQGITWKAYQEGISGNNCPLQDTGLYAVRHNPFVYFDDVTDGLDPNSPYCIEHVRPYSEFAADLASGNVAQYNFITPDLCHDMHDILFCETLDFGRNGDLWLSREMPRILDSDILNDSGALFIVWDEGIFSFSDGPIGMVVLSPFAKGGGYHNSIRYTHSSLLRTWQEIFGVTPLLGGAANAPNLSDLFDIYP